MVLRARYYDPSTGEFTSPDPLEYVDGMSLYTAYMIPDGLDPLGLTVYHHWLDNRTKGKFLALCQSLLDLLQMDWSDFRDYFTTPMDPGWGKPNSPHWWIHYGRDDKWHDLLNDEFGKSKDCCAALKALKNLIISATNAIQSGNNPGSIGPFHSPLVHYLDDFINSNEFLDELIECACDPEGCLCPPRIPLPKPRPYPKPIRFPDGFKPDGEIKDPVYWPPPIMPFSPNPVTNLPYPYSHSAHIH
jgi:hypothetical protein